VDKDPVVVTDGMSPVPLFTTTAVRVGTFAIPPSVMLPAANDDGLADIVGGETAVVPGNAIARPRWP